MNAIRVYNAYLRLPAEYQSRRTLAVLRAALVIIVRYDSGRTRRLVPPLKPVSRLMPVLPSIHSGKFSAVRTDAPPSF